MPPATVPAGSLAPTGRSQYESLFSNDRQTDPERRERAMQILPYTDEHELFRQSLRKHFEKEVTPHN